MPRLTKSNVTHRIVSKDRNYNNLNVDNLCSNKTELKEMLK